MYIKKPKTKDYYTNDGMHAAMRAYSAKLWKGDKVASVTFVNGSSGDFTFERATKEVKYKTPDGETYSETMTTAKFRDYVLSDDDMTLNQLKALALDWFSKDTKVLKIVWRDA